MSAEVMEGGVRPKAQLTAALNRARPLALAEVPPFVSMKKPTRFPGAVNPDIASPELKVKMTGFGV